MTADRSAVATRLVLIAAMITTILATASTSQAQTPTLGRTFVIGALTFDSGSRAWSDDERRAIESSVARLPRSITGRALIVERGGRPCLPDGLPADDDLLDSDSARAHLCDDGHSDPGRQAVLAVLYAFDRAVGWSARTDWRLLNGWRSSISSGWRSSAENVAPEAYAATAPETGTETETETAVETRATRSPRWDLVAFAAAAFTERASGDDRIVCRLMSQAAFLRARLAALDANAAREPIPRCEAFERWANLRQLKDVELVLAAPSSAMVGSLFGHLLLRLRYRDDSGDTPNDLGRAVAFLADNEAPFTDDPTYALKGIFGKYTASLHDRAFLVTYRDYAVIEGRDLRRWRIELSANERDRLMERIWTLRHAGRYRYYFFARNCATLMVDLINGALDPERAVIVPGLLAAPPASILERFERARASDGVRPLLAYVPEPLLAFEHQARLASTRRRAVERRLVGASPADVAPRLRATLLRANATDGAERAVGYADLAQLLARADVGDPADVYQFLRDSAALESHLSSVANLQAEERAYAARREELRRAVERLIRGLNEDAEHMQARPEPAAQAGGAALANSLMQIADDDPARRLAGYQLLGRQLLDLDLTALGPDSVARARLLVLFQSELRYDVTRMHAIPGLRDDLLFENADIPIDQQPYLAAFTGEKSAAEDARTLLALPSETRVSVALLALQKTKQIAFAERALHPSDETLAADLTADGDRATPAALARAYAGALPRSGIDQIAVLTSIGAERTDRAPWRGLDPGLLVLGALYDERLGDHRRFGFPSHTAMVVGRSSALLTWSAARPRVASYDTRIIGYRSLSPQLPEMQGPPLPLGWELSVDARGNQTRALAAGLTAGWGLILKLWERDDLADHLLMTGGVAYEADFPTAAANSTALVQHGLGVPIGLEFRGRLGPPDSHRSFWGARCFARPTWIAAGAPVQTALQAGVALEGHLALRARPVGGSHDPALLVSLQALHSSRSLTGPGPISEGSLSVGIELR
jgi:hypothetical protein